MMLEQAVHTGYHCALSLVSHFRICVFQPVTLPALFMAQPRLSQLAQRRARGRISKPASPAGTASYSNEYRRSVPAGRTDHSRSSSVKGKNVRSYISTLSIRRHDMQRDFTDKNTESAPSTNPANAGSSSSSSSSSSNHLNFSKYMKQDVKTYKGWRKSLQHGLSAVKHRMLVYSVRC